MDDVVVSGKELVGIVVNVEVGGAEDVIVVPFVVGTVPLLGRSTRYVEVSVSSNCFNCVARCGF